MRFVTEKERTGNKGIQRYTVTTHRTSSVGVITFDISGTAPVDGVLGTADGQRALLGEP